MNTHTHDITATHPWISALRTGGLAVAIASLALAGCELEPEPEPDDALGLESDLRQAGDPGAAVASLSLGEASTCMVTEAGSTTCWGHNDLGQLGRGDLFDIGDDETPDTAGFLELGAAAQQVATNGRQAYALLDDGTVRAWGHNAGYELGLQHDESVGDDETILEATVSTTLELGASAVELEVGEDFGCARLANGTIRCWGDNDLGQLGRGHTQPVGDDEPVTQGPLVFLGSPAVDLAVGGRHACAVTAAGAVYCWGRGAEGQLGHASVANLGDDEFPVVAGPVDVGGSAVRVVAGGAHTCALLVSGAVRCWGEGLYGQLGYGNTERVGDDETPASAGSVPVGGSVVGLAAGREHTCAVLEGGALRCWGHGELGQLGYGNTKSVGDGELPFEAGDLDLGEHLATAVFAGPLSRFTCALLDDQQLRCWGDNQHGQLGYGHTLVLGDDLAERPGYLPDILVLDDDEA